MSGYLGLPVADLERLIGLPAPLMIGSLILQGHEVPSRISIGGAQAVTIHKLPGGGRVIDAMGADPGAIVWHGVFVGPDAARRARSLDVMRQQGAPQILSFGDYTLTMVIVQYEYDYQDRGAVISYRIKGEIIPDLGQDTTAAGGLSFAVTEDLSTGMDLLEAAAATVIPYAPLSSRSDAVRVTALSATLTALALNLGDASDLASPEIVDLARSEALQTSLHGAGGAVQSAIVAASAANIGGTLSSQAFGSASGLAAATAQAGCLASLVQCGGYINRASANLAAAAAKQSAPLIHA